jgi:hypothetical protein
MKDSEFIELLNLYLDHEISAADAARLEAEVQSNPARRRIYQQYCRMQKACKLLTADFQAEPAQTAPTSERKVIAFNPTVAAVEAARRKRAGTLYTLGTFAAVAACIAIIFVGRRQNASSENATAPGAAQVATNAPSTIANPEAAFVASNEAAPRGLVSVAPRSQPLLLVRDPLLLTGTTQAEAVLTAAINEANSQLAWIESVQLAPLQQRPATDLQFTATLQSEGRPLGNRAGAPNKKGQVGEHYIGFGVSK